MITLRSKNPVRFEFADGIQETYVVLQPDDESETICAKLQRVLELEGYASTPQRAPLPIFTAADRAATDERLAQAQPMGWSEDTDIENLPEF